MEVHEEPSRAKSDAGNALRLDALEPLLRKLTRIERAVRAETDAPSHVGDGVRA
jgi:2-dehydro-3-deoxyphosphooctonate aldolase (KDO 8-P synthase)